MILDVVYNHLGPSGNYLPEFSDRWLSDRHATDWGTGLNYDAEGCGPVRAFFAENAAHWIEVEQKQHFFDPALQAIYDQARAVSPAGASLEIISWSRDRSRVLIYREQGLDGGAYFIFTPADRRMLRIANRYPEIAAAPQGVRQSLTYRARDGQRIPAYLTLPGAGQARNLPLVLLVHGGPAARDTIDFDWWAAFLASRGYAVVQPNYRGSSGYGATWQRAGHGQWGGLMQTDVEDAVDALARSGVADPRRVCIVGASYGGYAALAGASDIQPATERAAATAAAPTNFLIAILLRSLLDTLKITRITNFRSPHPSLVLMKAIQAGLCSPAQHKDD